MKTLLLVALVFVSNVYAATTLSLNLTHDAIVSIYDGDTFTVNIGDCPAVLCERIPVRINGIDAPEMRGKAIELRNVARDKYFRIRADVFVDGVNIGAEMIEKSLARTYGGGKRLGWCF